MTRGGCFWVAIYAATLQAARGLLGGELTHAVP